MNSNHLELPHLNPTSKSTERMNRAKWSADFLFCSHGLRIGGRATDAQLLERMVPCLPPRWKPASGETVDHLYSLSAGLDGRRYHPLYVGVVNFARSLAFEEMLFTFQSDLELRAEFEARPRNLVRIC